MDEGLVFGCLVTEYAVNKSWVNREMNIERFLLDCELHSRKMIVLDDPDLIFIGRNVDLMFFHYFPLYQLQLSTPKKICCTG
jgi:hypothetical protein